MFRFHFHNDELEEIAHTFYFSTDKFYLCLKNKDIIAGQSIDDVFAEMRKVCGEDYERNRTIIKKVFSQKEREFQKWFGELHEAFRRLLAWEQSNTRIFSHVMPFGRGFIYNPSDPKKGKK